MKSILVTNTGDKLHALSLIERQDLNVTIVTEKRFLDMYPAGTDIIFVENLNDPSTSTHTVVRNRDCNQYEAVVSLSERAAPLGAYLRNYLGIDGPSFDTIMNCTNKYTMKRRFSANGLPTPRFAMAYSPKGVATIAQEFKSPIIVKPIIGAGTDATKVFKEITDLNQKEAQNYFHKLSYPKTTSEKQFPVVVEEFINVNEELHCDGFVENGKVVFARVSKYLRPVLEYSDDVFGSYTLGQADPLSKEILKMHEIAVQSVGIQNGVTHFEVFNSDKGLIAGEIACRPGGGGIRKMLQLQSGFDSWEAHLQSSLCEKYTWENTANPEKQVMQLMLPSRRGKISSISTYDDFKSVPGLLEGDINLKTGDVVDGLMDSSSVSGLLYIQFDNSSELDHLISTVKNQFYIEVEDPEYNKIPIK